MVKHDYGVAGDKFIKLIELENISEGDYLSRPVYRYSGTGVWHNSNWLQSESTGCLSFDFRTKMSRIEGNIKGEYVDIPFNEYPIIISDGGYRECFNTNGRSSYTQLHIRTKSGKTLGLKTFDSRYSFKSKALWDNVETFNTIMEILNSISDDESTYFPYFLKDYKRDKFIKEIPGFIISLFGVLIVICLFFFLVHKCHQGCI